MGTLFPGSSEYPDHKPIPSPLDAPVGTLTLTAYIGLVPLCPAEMRHADDMPHADHAPQSMRVSTPAPSTTSDLSINIPAEHMSITGLAPTVRIG
jgi:hypothetical protein